MTTGEEKRAYSRGYATGRAKVKADRNVIARQRERQAFLDRTFLAALPFAMTQSTWGIGKGNETRPINTIAERVDLAWDVAQEALKQRRCA